ncbi:MAG TPA: MOSC N-terminal beta barrel domain-containing protein [Steroidobacteraceae bacterium]
MTVTIEDLFVYPVKSARGIRKPTVLLGPTGFEWDRNWMIVDDTGKFISQRTHPKLAQVVPQLGEDRLILEAPGMKALHVVRKAGQRFGTAPLVTVRVWNDACQGVDQGDAAARWVSQFLGEELRLVQVVESPQRRANPKYAGEDFNPVTFPDGFPILVCNRASLEELNTRMPEPVPMNRFRPNIVLGGLPAFAEDRIASLRWGEIELRLVKPCTRCIITSTDQQTGERTTNPLPVLREFRFDRDLLGVTFGENAVVSRGVGSALELGLSAEVIYDR